MFYVPQSLIESLPGSLLVSSNLLWSDLDFLVKI